MVTSWLRTPLGNVAARHATGGGKQTPPVISPLLVVLVFFLIEADRLKKRLLAKRIA